MRIQVLALCTFLILSVGSYVDAGYPLVANQGRQLCWFDEEGRLTGKLELKNAPHDLHQLSNGNWLTHQGTEVIEIDHKTQRIVWSFETKTLATVDRVELHSVVPLPDGNLMVALSGEGKLFEIDRLGKVHLSFPFKIQAPHPHRDTRLVRLVMEEDDWNYLVAHEGDGVVREYDRSGDVVWEFEVPMFGKKPKRGHGPEAFGNAVFSAIRLSGGDTLIGTGNGHSILRVTPAKEIVWQVQQDDLPGIRLAWVTTLQLRKNGNLIIGNCHAGPDQPQLIEIDWDKNVVWQFLDEEHLGNSVSNSVVLTD